MSVPSFDPDRDHYAGSRQPKVTLIEYGDFTCPQCRQVREILRRVVTRLPDEITFVFRPDPLASRAPVSDEAARVALAAAEQDAFWRAHADLFEYELDFSEDALRERASRLEIDPDRFLADVRSDAVGARLKEAKEEARSVGASTTPSLFIDGEPYDDAWDERSIMEAIERPLHRRLQLASQRFFDWAASGGLVLILATLLALFLVNIGFNEGYQALRDAEIGISINDAGFALSLQAWINDGLMAVFFLLVGIEIKREVLNGELSDPRQAALPLVGAVGGMIVPAAIYASINISGGAMQGWGVPVATDIAFTLGLLALVGRRAPISLTVFVSALAIADDLGAILVIAIFYGHGFEPVMAGWAVAVLGLMLGLNLAGVYARAPYILSGVVLWWFVHESGLHATLAGVLTAALIPSRPAASLRGIAAQASAILNAEASAEREQIGSGAYSVLHRAVERLREPGFHMERSFARWTNFAILPLFAFFNTGIVLSQESFAPLSPPALGVILGLCIGKPLGIFGCCWLAVRYRIATLSAEIEWSQLLGAACLAGIGFTMSIFIATAAFEGTQLEIVKLSVLIASSVSAIAGCLILTQGPRFAGQGMARARLAGGGQELQEPASS